MTTRLVAPGGWRLSGCERERPIAVRAPSSVSGVWFSEAEKEKIIQRVLVAPVLMPLNLHYESRFAPVASLRPEIKVELNARPPALPTVALPIASMLDVLIQAPKTGLQFECIGIEETLAEKVLSFLRRTAEARAGRNRADYDCRLVRHLYDVRVAYSGETGQSFHAKLDSHSRANWTVGA